MLRRTRYLLPALAIGAALLGVSGLLPAWVLLVVVVVAAVAVDIVLTRVSEQRLRQVTDQVEAFAADVRQPAPFESSGGAEWQRLVTALQEVARILLERFEELRAERERVERVLDAIPSAVLLFTARGLIYANPAARGMFALPEAVTEPSAGPAGDLLSPLRALGVAGLAEAVEEIAETGLGITVQVARDGRLLSATGSSIARGEVALIVTDLTDVRRVEAMRRDFVANASHELKTPVTGMQALAESLDMAIERDPERARSMVHRIQSESTRMARLVRELLDLTRLEEAATSARMVRVDIARLVRDQVARLEDVADHIGVDIEVDVPDEVHMIGVVEDLRLVVRNLVMNAIAYNTRGGSVRVDLSRAGGFVELTVADDGIGIPEASHDRIFERFYRVDKARSRAAGGTGLGLSMVRNAVEGHGGQVSVRSVLGEGSTFTVRLPVDGGISE